MSTTTEVQLAESTLTKATQAEFKEDYDQGFRLYVRAAESFLHLSRLNTLPDKTRQQCKANASKALQRAEKIKHFFERTKGSNLAAATADTAYLTPVAINHFSPQEQWYVLKKGELVNGIRFSLWEDPPPYSTSSKPFSDPEGQPNLSPEQLKVSTVWERPAVMDKQATYDDRPILPQEILQHVVTDCSVCASISVCLEHTRRFGSHLAESSMYPPKRSSERYDVRVMFNGAWRRIVIDDKLPFNPQDNTLMCLSILPSPTSDLSTRKSLWPSLLEKAYMKLMGGYDFPGSNSSADLHALGGWIPEHIEMRSPTFERERTWERVSTSFTKGTTGETHIRWGDTFLLPSHSYAVINIYKSNETRYFTILDSWVRTHEEQRLPSRILDIPWSEVVNVFDSIYLSWDPALWPHTLTFQGMWRRNTEDTEDTQHLQVSFSNNNQPVNNDVWVLLTRHVSDTRRTSDFTSLRVDVEDDISPDTKAVIDNQVTLSAKATYTNGIHSLTEVVLMAKNAGGNCKYPTFMANPQYRLAIRPPKGAVDGTGQGKAHLAITLQGGKDIPVNVAVVWSRGERVSELPEKDLAVTSGAYTYGMARAAKELMPGQYTVVASAFEPHHTGPLSLKVECSLPFDFTPIPQEGAGMYTTVVKGAWEGLSAAGGPSFKRYHDNPTFQVNLPAASKLQVRLQLLRTSTTPIPLNLTIYNQRPSSSSIPVMSSQIATTGAYDDAIAGVVTPVLALGAGKYYLVPSTYATSIEVGFKLIVHSTAPNLRVIKL